MDFPPKHMSSIITGLRSGFIYLKYYKHILQQIDSPNCECGEIQTVEHYFLHFVKIMTVPERNYEQNSILSPEVWKSI